MCIQCQQRSLLWSVVLSVTHNSATLRNRHQNRYSHLNLTDHNKVIHRSTGYSMLISDFIKYLNTVLLYTKRPACNTSTIPAYRISQPIRRTVIFLLEILEKNNHECILILVIYWKKTGLLHTKISNHNIRRRSNLGHIFREKKCVLWAGKYGIYI